MNASLVASATRVSDSYFRIASRVVGPGTYLLVAVTEENAIYSLSVNDGVREPILGAFRFPRINLTTAARRYLNGVFLK